MKEIKAYIREHRLNGVVRALRTAGAQAVTVVKTVPMGAEVEPEYVELSRAVPVEHFTPMLKLELVCDDRQADRYVDIIRDEARTGERGDGVIFVSAVDEAVRIRNVSAATGCFNPAIHLSCTTAKLTLRPRCPRAHDLRARSPVPEAINAARA